MNPNQDTSDLKKERFYRVAEKRVNKVLKDLRLLSQCSNKYVYEYTDEDVQSMFREIEKEVRQAKQSFVSREESQGFKFRS